MVVGSHGSETQFAWRIAPPCPPAPEPPAAFPQLKVKIERLLDLPWRADKDCGWSSPDDIIFSTHYHQQE
jgi:hypothetical protein